MTTRPAGGCASRCTTPPPLLPRCRVDSASNIHAPSVSLFWSGYLAPNVMLTVHQIYMILQCPHFEAATVAPDVMLTVYQLYMLLQCPHFEMLLWHPHSCMSCWQCIKYTCFFSVLILRQLLWPQMLSVAPRMSCWQCINNTCPLCSNFETAGSHFCVQQPTGSQNLCCQETKGCPPSQSNCLMIKGSTSSRAP